MIKIPHLADVKEKAKPLRNPAPIENTSSQPLKHTAHVSGQPTIYGRQRLTSNVEELRKKYHID